MSEVVRLLKDAAGYAENEIAEKFVITENQKEYVIKAVDYLDAKTFKAIAQAVGAKGGGYIPGKTATFTIPKTSLEHGMESEPVYKEPRNGIRTVPLIALLPPVFRVRVKPEMELAQLVESIKTYGVLEPIIVRSKGDLYEIVAGDRRVKAAKNAGLTEIPVIIKQLSDIDAFAIQLTENLHRQDLTPEEKSMALAEFAKFTKYNGKQIAVALGMSDGWVYKYLPQDFKDKEFVELGKLGAESKAESQKEEDLHIGTRRAPTSELKPISGKEQDLGTSETIIPKGNSGQVYKTYLLGMRECEKCGKQAERDKMHFVDNRLICPECAGKTKAPPKPPEPKPEKPYKEKADFRVAQMQPQKSKFELDVIQELQMEGVPLETDQEFCVAKTIPDAIHRAKKIAFYIDLEELHPEGNEKDERMRSGLEQFYDFTVFPIRYKANTKEEKEKAKAEMREILKW